MAGFKPSDVMVIRKVTPNITTLSLPFARFGTFKVGGRSTIVRLASGALAVFSPVALTPEVRRTLEDLGNEVRYITAPDIEHHMSIGEWYQAYPNARVIGPEGLPEKRASQKKETVPFSTVFTQKNKHDVRIGEDFDRDFDYEYVGSHANKELVFLHRPDRTLIQADLLWNLPAYEQYSRTGESPTAGILSRMFAGMMTTAGTAVWQKRFSWYAASSKDRTDYNACVQRINQWDFDRIIPCHGDVIESGGKGVFRKVLEWHLRARK